jgi:hypothetical protein
LRQPKFKRLDKLADHIPTEPISGLIFDVIGRKMFSLLKHGDTVHDLHKECRGFPMAHAFQVSPVTQTSDSLSSSVAVILEASHVFIVSVNSGRSLRVAYAAAGRKK